MSSSTDVPELLRRPAIELTERAINTYLHRHICQSLTAALNSAQWAALWMQPGAEALVERLEELVREVGCTPLPFP